MKAALFALRSNDLLGFVERRHSSIPSSSTLILSFNSVSAAWRFNLPKHQALICARGSQHPSSMSIQELWPSVKFKKSDSMFLFKSFNRNLTPELTRRHTTPSKTSLADEGRTISARVE
jgi:hypothetical protein